MAKISENPPSYVEPQVQPPPAAPQNSSGSSPSSQQQQQQPMITGYYEPQPLPQPPPGGFQSGQPVEAPKRKDDCCCGFSKICCIITWIVVTIVIVLIVVTSIVLLVVLVVVAVDEVTEEFKPLDITEKFSKKDPKYDSTATLECYSCLSCKNKWSPNTLNKTTYEPGQICYTTTETLKILTYGEGQLPSEISTTIRKGCTFETDVKCHHHRPDLRPGKYQLYGDPATETVQCACRTSGCNKNNGCWCNNSAKSLSQVGWTKFFSLWPPFLTLSWRLLVVV